MSAKDVVAKAKTDGISLTEAYVYTIRSSSKKAAKRGARGTGRVGRPAGTDARDARFRELALGMGLDRARALITEMERKLAALINRG
jgi:hypothetical protein